MRLITLTTALLAALALVPATAGAGARQYALFQDEALITQSAGTRGPTLDEVKALGVDMIKVQLSWNVVAPGGRTKPKGFDGRTAALGNSAVKFGKLVNSSTIN